MQFFLFMSFLCFYDICRFEFGNVLDSVVCIVFHLIFPHSFNVFRRLVDLKVVFEEMCLTFHLTTSNNMSSLLGR